MHGMITFLVTGAVEEDKKTFIRILHTPEPSRKKRNRLTRSTKDYNADGLFGRIPLHDNLLVFLFATPPEFKADNEFIWEIQAEGMDAFILLLDAARSDTLEKSRPLVKALRDYEPVPFIVALTNPAESDVLMMDTIRDALTPQGNPAIVRWVLADPEGVRAEVMRMMAMIPDDMP